MLDENQVRKMQKEEEACLKADMEMIQRRETIKSSMYNHMAEHGIRLAVIEEILEEG